MQDGFEIRQIRISREPDSRERTKLVSGKLGNADRCADQFEPLSECLTGDHFDWGPFELGTLELGTLELGTEEQNDRHQRPQPAFFSRQ